MSFTKLLLLGGGGFGIDAVSSQLEAVFGRAYAELFLQTKDAQRYLPARISSTDVLDEESTQTLPIRIIRGLFGRARKSTPFTKTGNHPKLGGKGKLRRYLGFSRQSCSVGLGSS